MSGSLSCRTAVELLPWYVHQSLAAGERAALDEHLAGCASCRAELYATRRMAALAATHAPAERLADYACGLAIGAQERRALEEHLAACPTCSEELAMALASSESDGQSRAASVAPADAPGRWRLLVLAACLVAAIGASGVWWGSRQASTPPIGAVAWVELLPSGERLRGGSENGVEVARSRDTALVLHTDRVLDPVEHRVRFARQGDELAVIAGLRPESSGAVVLHVPALALPAADLELTLEAGGAGAWRPIESYSLRVVL